MPRFVADGFFLNVGFNRDVGIRTIKVSWVRFIWDLPTVKDQISPPVGYQFYSAGCVQAGEILQVVLSAYASDPVWKPMMDSIKQRMTERIQTTLGSHDADYIVAKHGKDIVGVSGVAKSHWTDQNLLTGICVVPAHQQRGLGTYLLGLSLLRLRDMGAESAKVYTQAGSLADNKIYPLLGSTREAGVFYPGLAH